MTNLSQKCFKVVVNHTQAFYADCLMDLDSLANKMLKKKSKTLKIQCLNESGKVATYLKLVFLFVTVDVTSKVAIGRLWET